MNYAVNVVFLENLVHCSSVADVGVVEFGHNAGDLLNAVKTFLACIDEVVHDYYVVMLIDEFYHGVRADITRSAGNQNAFHGF